MRRKEEDVTYRSIHREREYGGYWYSGLWRILRPVLVALTVLVVVLGIGTRVWNRLYGEFIAPVDAADPAEYTFGIQSGDSLNRVASNLESAGLIHEIKPVRQIIDDTIAGFWREIDRLSALRR